MSEVIDTRCYPAIGKSLTMAHVNVAEPLTKKCEEAVNTFYGISKKNLLQTLDNGGELEKVKVPISTMNLSLKEREQFEDILHRYGNWSVFCGDRFITIFTPIYGLDDPKGTQYTYLVKSGRICPACSTFTEYNEVEARWVCSSCGRWVGCYPDSDFAMGQVATTSERKHRVYTHKLIDRLWKDELMQRKEIYQELSEILRVPKQYTHIAMLEDTTLPIVNTWAIAKYEQKTKEKKENENGKCVQN